MAHEADCIFCKIVAGEIPCFKLREDEAGLRSRQRARAR